MQETNELTDVPFGLSMQMSHDVIGVQRGEPPVKGQQSDDTQPAGGGVVD